jgi:hypothetical protein
MMRPSFTVICVFLQLTQCCSYSINKNYLKFYNFYNKVFVGSQNVYSKANKARQLQAHQFLGHLDLNLVVLEIL